MTTAEVMTLPTVCPSFPALAHPQIHRDNLLTTIRMTLSGDTDVLIVEGPDGIGKTTLAAQFANEHPSSTISLFISTASPYGYDLDKLRFDLCNQIHWLINGEELLDPDHATT